MSVFQILKNLITHPLGRLSPLKTVFRFVYWQVYYRVVKRQKWINLIGTVKINLKPSLAGVTGNYYTGLLEFEEMSFLLHFLRKGDEFIDIGANVGVYTLLASGYCGARTTAVEPVHETAKVLTANIKANGLEDSVKVIQKIVSSEPGVLKISNNRDAMNSIVRGEKVDNVEFVETIALDEITKRIPILAKIDVEGEEFGVVQSGIKTLMNDDFQAVIMETNGETDQAIASRTMLVNKMNSLGFAMYKYDPFTRHISELENPGVHNTIFIKDIDLVKERIQGAPSFTINGHVI
jgi:FkbM family methyltransferase